MYIGNIYLVIVLLILCGNYVLHLIVDILNVRHANPVLPKEFEGHYDAHKYRQSQIYLRENTYFQLVEDVFITSLTIGFILFGGFNFIDQFARSFGRGEIITGIIFAGMLIFAHQLLEMPFSLYHTFGIEEKYGFNKTTAATFFIDLIKSWVLTIVIGGIIFSIILWFFAEIGRLAWLYCWIVLTVFELFMVFIAPVLILPIFNKFTPLPQGELRQAIEEYVRQQSFKIQGIFTMDGSRRSSKSNAFFTGFGKYKRIVLFDTLIQNHTVAELVSILAHEIGHYKKKHIFSSIAIEIITQGFMFFILSLFINNELLFSAFKMENVSIYAGIFFFSFLYTPIYMAISIFHNFITRKNEYEADIYSVKTCYEPFSLIDALKKLSVHNLSNLTPHPLKVFLQDSHPPILERIRNIRANI